MVEGQEGAVGARGGEGLWERVLVTGGAGFIGSNLVAAIQREHPEAWVTVIDDFRSGDFANLRGFSGDLLAFDLSRFDLEGALADSPPTLAFHLASITDTTVTDTPLMVHDNLEGARRLFSFCAKRGIPLVYASSAAVYGTGGGRMSEATPPAPANCYAFSKMLLDNLARRMAAANPGWHVVGLRYFNVYGPGEAHKGNAASMVWQLACQMAAGRRPRLFKHGEQKRDFVYVKDVVDATLCAATCKASGVYNVGSGKARSFNELVDILNDVLGTRLDPEYIDNPYPFYQPFTEADLTRAGRDLGYRPRFQLEEGVRDYLASVSLPAGAGR